MKLIIDIDEGMLESIKDGYWCGGHKLELAIRNGTPYEERPQGEWKFIEFEENTGIENSEWCPFCGKVKAQVYENFCGYCGADMRKETENESKRFD